MKRKILIAIAVLASAASSSASPGSTHTQTIKSESVVPPTPCGWPPPTPSPSFTIVWPETESAASAARTIVIKTYTPSLYSIAHDSYTSPLRLEPVLPDSHPGTVTLSLPPLTAGTEVVVNAEYTHWIQTLPCFEMQTEQIGSFVVKSS
jgi:hypothetical protein